MTVFYYFFLPSVYMQKSVSITYRQKSLCVLNNSQGLSFLSSLLPQIQKKKKSVSVSPINNPLGFDFRQREICSTSGHKLHGKESPKGERSSLCVVIESGDSTLKISTKLEIKEKTEKSSILFPSTSLTWVLSHPWSVSRLGSHGCTGMGRDSWAG